MQLTCPKCHGYLRQYERNGVNVDQCTDCRGIFLDRGELERLIDAENSWHGAPPAAPAAPPAPALPYPPPERSYQERPRSYDDRSHHDRDGYPRKKRKSFLEDLFD
jgi:Zn-finger nucleic acid-binding protein